MPHHRDRIPDDLKELIGLIRAGKIFAVQQWIAEGKRLRMPDGNFTTQPFRAALETGFHSLVEVLLKAGVEQDEKDYGLSQAISHRRLDIIELLAEHGAEIRTVTFDDILWTGNLVIIQWFIDRGFDMETGWPISHAFRYRHREFLGIYMEMRDKLPSARMQATMALRLHAREGDMKWVSLLIWADAAPRMEVPDLEAEPPASNMGTALADAVRNGHEAIVRKIGIKPGGDEATRLLEQCAFCREPRIIQMLIDAGADPTQNEGESGAMESVITAFGWAMKTGSSSRSPDTQIQCIEIVARAGGRWRPREQYQYRGFRTALGRSSPYLAVGWLVRMVDSGAIERDVFTELMRTPKMRQLLATSAPGAVRLREVAGAETKPSAPFPKRVRKPV